MTATIKNPQKKNRTVIDQHGHPYELTGKIGEGGQGIVCSTNYPNVLVKITRATSDEKRTSWVTKICDLMRQPLNGLPIAQPLALITRPQPGYIMELMDGLVPLSDLLQKSANDLSLAGYIKTGGILRRLKILARLARVLADLHGRGLAYGDLSPANIFVSQSLDYAEVWLIDADNISSQSSDSQHSIFTPDYGAPEIMRNESGINTLTDSWSFAVIAYRFLTMVHPLKGDDVLAGEPEREDAALRGELPWVDHLTDRSNALQIGLPREITFNTPLRHLFEQCFNASMHCPGDRPSMNEWAEALEEATGHCNHCSSCSSTFFYTSEHLCPFCDAKQSPDQALVMAEYFYTPREILLDQLCDENQQEIPAGFSNKKWDDLGDQEKSLISNYCWSATGKRLVLTKESVKLTDGNSSCTARLTDSFEPEIILDSTGSIHLTRQGGKPVELKRSHTFKKEKRTGAQGELHFGSMSHERIVWKFKW